MFRLPKASAMISLATFNIYYFLITNYYVKTYYIFKVKQILQEIINNNYELIIILKNILIVDDDVNTS